MYKYIVKLNDWIKKIAENPKLKRIKKIENKDLNPYLILILTVFITLL